ncbi:hypothetical protein [Brevundimonas viscosa]|nr:hypothetical protein [Brevundimonas viscosa]
MVVSGCVAPQPHSGRTVAAFEVQLHTPSDRAEFLAILRQVSQAEGLHVDAENDESLRYTAEAIPEANRTLRAAIWRGTEDDHAEAVIMDGHDHLGLVWIAFLEGEDPASATRFRERVMNRLVLRWPETMSLPVMPTGSIPNPHQLVKTRSGYKLDPAYVSSYEVKASSRLVSHPQAD